MAATANFVTQQLNLTLRVGMLSVAKIRAAGHDVRVARYAASEEAVYAMFSGAAPPMPNPSSRPGESPSTLHPPARSPTLPAYPVAGRR
jgi:hypothetical protein